MLKLSPELATAIALILLVNPVRAEQKWPHMPTPSETAMMPDYCQARMGGHTELYQQWNKRMGPDKFMHLHHYCHGLKAMSRYRLTFDKQQRRYILKEAISQFDYVLRRWPDGFDLKADAEAKKMQAENLLRLL